MGLEDYRHYRRYYRRLRDFYQKKPVRDFTFLILSLLTAAFFSFFAIRPSLKTIGKLVKEIKDKRMATQKLEEKINALSLAQKEYARVQPDLVYVYTALPQKINFSRLIKKIEYLAQKNKTPLLNLRIQKVSLFGQEPKKLASFEVAFKLGGDYQNLKNLLTDLERLDRSITLNSFSFSRTQSGEENWPLFLTITIQSYYWP